MIYKYISFIRVKKEREERKMALKETTIQCYLGEKGYTIYQNSLSKQQLDKIKKDLTVIPYSAVKIGFTENTSYTVYLEDTKNKNKIYIPYFYGVREFSFPKEIRIHSGVSIPEENAIYRGHILRENQLPVVEAYMTLIKSDPSFKKGGLLELHTGFGKTLIAIYLISQLRLKTLIVVQKEFLLNQWLENITAFMPQARIGRIQGEKMDIHDKDIVIGMLQSLSMKDYPPALFESFGFLIVDEVHHISSEVFSKALSKIITRYTLGLSATMERKDRTTWVFKAFLGEVIYKAIKRDIDYGVVVRAIEYQSDPNLYDGIQKDNKGNPLYSCMISRICEYNRRTEFIVKVIFDTFIENPNQQIMVLANNRNILEYIHDAIKRYIVCDKFHQRIASDTLSEFAPIMEEKKNNMVGYYLGGMKDIELKKSEKKTVILATFAMASEALDIKTLTTLFLITSKTDIVQSVGRILRAKNESSPVIYDIIDSHPIFRNQWTKRKAFYKKEGYKIFKTTDKMYASVSWDIDWDPITKKSQKQSSSSSSSSIIESNDNIDIFSKCMIK